MSHEAARWVPPRGKGGPISNNLSIEVEKHPRGASRMSDDEATDIWTDIPTCHCGAGIVSFTIYQSCPDPFTPSTWSDITGIAKCADGHTTPIKTEQRNELFTTESL